MIFDDADGGTWLEEQDPADGTYDLIFADTWPGKFDHLDEALALVPVGGIYLVDDLLPQPTWPEGHQAKVDALVARLASLNGWKTVKIDSLAGIMICTRVDR